MTLYIPPLFRVEDRRALFDFVAAHAFGTLVCSSAGELQVSHIPFLPEMDANATMRLLGHLARANPQAAALAGAERVVAIFQGPHAYVSPTWYEHHPAVPTWNYAVVHAHGRVRPMDEAQLRDLIKRLSEIYEAGRPAPWRFEDLPADFAAGMVKTITGFTLEVERLEGKFKLSQNRPGRDAERTAAALEAEGEGALAALMRAHRARAKA